MSYAVIAPSPARAMGSLLDMNINTKAYYIALVQEFDRKWGLKKYYWSPVRYLSNWDAMGFQQSYSKQNPTSYTNATLYEWVVDAFGRGSYKKTNLAVI